MRCTTLETFFPGLTFLALVGLSLWSFNPSSNRCGSKTTLQYGSFYGCSFTQFYHPGYSVDNERGRRFVHREQGKYSYTRRNKFWHPYLIKYYWNESLWMDIKYLKSATRLLNRVCGLRRGLDLSKEVLWVSVCQRAVKLPAGKVGGLKKNSAMRPGAGESVSNSVAWHNFFSNLQLC